MSGATSRARRSAADVAIVGSGEAAADAPEGSFGDLQKAMGNPKVMAAVQKAAGNPKVMAAVQDVMQNGPGAMKKYENDREVKAILDELKGIL